MGSGVVFFDYDGDGAQDLFFVNSTRFPGRTEKPGLPALYKNDGKGRFTDVTKAAGLAVEMYGLGAAAADYDNDGHVDLYVTGLGPNRLFRNLGGGTFADVTAKAGVGDPGFSTSAMFFDYDKDGRLDLVVANYVAWSIEKDLFCTLDGKSKSYCTPESYKGQSLQALSRPRGRRLRGRHEEGRARGRARQVARPRPHRLRLRLLARPLRRQRHPAQQALQEQRQRQLQRRRRGRGRRLRRDGRRARRHGRRRRRLQRQRPAVAADRELLERDARPLPQRGQRALHRRGAVLERRPGLAAHAQLRGVLLRLRPRRQAGHLLGGRPRGGRHPEGPAQGELRAAAAPLPQPGQQALRGRRGARRSRAWRGRWSRAARPTPTWTATATSTSR